MVQPFSYALVLLFLIYAVFCYALGCYLFTKLKTKRLCVVVIFRWLESIYWLLLTWKFPDSKGSVCWITRSWLIVSLGFWQKLNQFFSLSSVLFFPFLLVIVLFLHLLFLEIAIWLSFFLSSFFFSPFFLQVGHLSSVLLLLQVRD